jgi:hypothetical protein
MNLLIPSSKISRQRFPCPLCQAPTPVDVITEIHSEDDLNNFISLHLNRARCPSCGAEVEAPVRVTARFPDFPALNHDCVPMVLLENPEMLDELLHNSPADSRRVYSLDELERSIAATLLLEMHRNNGNPENADFSLVSRKIQIVG